MTVTADNVVTHLRHLGFDAHIEDGPAPTDVIVNVNDNLTCGFMVADDDATAPATAWNDDGPLDETGPVADAVQTYMPPPVDADPTPTADEIARLIAATIDRIVDAAACRHPNQRVSEHDFHFYCVDCGEHLGR